MESSFYSGELIPLKIIFRRAHFSQESSYLSKTGDDPPMFRFTVDPQCWLRQCMQRSALVSVLFGPQIPLLPAVACYHILFASGESCSVAQSALAILNSGLRTTTAHQKSVGNSMGHVYMTVQAITISGASTAQVAARGFYLECVINLLPNAGSVVTVPPVSDYTHVLMYKRE